MSFFETTRRHHMALVFVVATAGASMITTPSHAGIQICLKSDGSFDDILNKLQKYDNQLETVFRNHDGNDLFYCTHDKSGQFTLFKYNERAKTLCDPKPVPECPKNSTPMS